MCFGTKKAVKPGGTEPRQAPMDHSYNWLNASALKYSRTYSILRTVMIGMMALGNINLPR